MIKKIVSSITLKDIVLEYLFIWFIFYQLKLYRLPFILISEAWHVTYLNKYSLS
jgi:hypothetical protein